MMLALSLAWLGVGLLVLANPERAQRALACKPGPVLAWLTRTMGAGLLALAAWPLACETSTALSVVALLLAAMALSSLAALLLPLRPRLYAASMPLSALTAAISWCCA